MTRRPHDLWGHPPGEAPAPRQVLFFAVRPDPAALERAARLATRLRHELGITGHAVAPERYHITLCAFGPRARLREAPEQAMARAAATLEAAPVEVRLDAFGHFRGRRNHPLILLGDERTARDLGALRERLAVALLRQGIPVERQPAFLPHMTLFYQDGECPPRQSVEPVAWRAEEFLLIRSWQGLGRHDVLGRWALTAAGPA